MRTWPLWASTRPWRAVLLQTWPQRRSFSGNWFERASITEDKASQPSRLQTLAIETSCDDTSVAILQICKDGSKCDFQTEVLFHEKITSNSEAYGGIHPLVALHSHQRELAQLVSNALTHVRSIQQDNPSSGGALSHHASRHAPDFVSVTRGPGMGANLSVGLELAKGLAIAWDVPLVGVHHMQAHALTSRLCTSLGRRAVHRSDDIDGKDDDEVVRWTPDDLEPKFPFLTVLASGGHTMLVDSQALTEHKILASTGDIAIGDCLDKAARAILPEADLKAPYGKALEDFAFPTGDYSYHAPVKRGEELQTRKTRWDWAFRPPMSESKGPEKSNKRMEYTFGGLVSSVERFMTSQVSTNGDARLQTRAGGDVSIDERRDMAAELQRVAFEHVGSRIMIYLTSLPTAEAKKIRDVVVSGGVAANHFLRHILRGMLDARGFGHIRLSFPPAELCTDNALMIAWAGMEMFDAGFESALTVRPRRKWSMDASADDGGIVGGGEWKTRPSNEASQR